MKDVSWMSLDDYSSMIAKESASGDVTLIEDEAYIKASELLHKLELDVLSQEGLSRLLSSARDLVFLVIRNLLHLRLSKVVKKISLGERPLNMTVEEGLVASKIEEATSLTMFILKSIKNGSPISLYMVRERAKSLDLSVVEVKSGIPKFVGIDLNTYGEFEKGDIAVVPYENARILSLQGKAEEVVVV